MKTILIPFVVLFYSFSAIAQEGSKGDNAIIIKTQDSSEEAFRNIGRLLSANGFSIDNANKDFGTITTTEKRMGNQFDPLWEFKITALIEDSSIVLTAMCKHEDSSWEQLEKRGALNMKTKGWNQILEIAQKYENGTLEFEKRD